MSKPGSAGVASSTYSNVERRERLRQLALDTVDLSKDPYLMKNHLGSFECKLCLTLHPNEASYLAHTQGKRHQQNLGRRAARKAKESGTATGITNRAIGVSSAPKVRSTPKIGVPEHYVFKVRRVINGTNRLGLLVVIKYPQILASFEPRTRFMSALEQKVETADLNYQYVLFAAEPYNTVAFKVPNLPIDKTDAPIIQHWDANSKIFSFQFHFKPVDQK